MSNPSKVELTVSNRTIIRVIFIILATLISIRFLMAVSHVLALVVISLFLAIALNPVIDRIRKHLRIKSRAAATGVAYLCVLAILVGLFLIIIPPLASQTSTFVTSLPDTVQQIKKPESSIGRLINRYQLQDNVDTLSKTLSERVKDLPQPVLSNAGRIGATVASLIAVLVMTFMMIVEGPKWLDRFWRLQPKSRREHNQLVARQMYGVITGYVNGQLVVASIAAFFALIAMLIASNVLNVSINALGLAGVVCLTGLIPMFGNAAGSIIVIAVCALTSLPLALIMLIFFMVYQQIENMTIQPIIQSRKSELTPLLVFIAVLIGFSFGGLLGSILAIPVAGCLKVLTNDYYRSQIAKHS
jgi:predicted PurR-regulated permease PerM